MLRTAPTGPAASVAALQEGRPAPLRPDRLALSRPGRRGRGRSRLVLDRDARRVRPDHRARLILAALYYKPSPDDRTTYEGLTSQSVDLVATNGTHTITLNFNGQNVPDSLDDDLPIDKVYMQNYKLKSQWDPSAGTDITFTFA
jgi:hypothetical protein